MKEIKKLTIVERTTASIGSLTSLTLHTVVFCGAFAVAIFGIASWETVLLVLTTLVSLEAIYLAIFIQMTVNRNTAQLQEVEEDIDEIQEDVEELSEDVDEIQEDIEDIQEDVEEMSQEEEPGQSPETSVTLEELSHKVRGILEDLETLKVKSKQ